jgi:hypothetical protein
MARTQLSSGMYIQSEDMDAFARTHGRTWTHQLLVLTMNTIGHVTWATRIDRLVTTKKASDRVMGETARKVAPRLTSGFTYLHCKKIRLQVNVYPVRTHARTNECTSLHTGAN